MTDTTVQNARQRLKSIALVPALVAMAACGGGTDANGNVTGPFGQDPLMISDVQNAFRAGVAACVDYKTANAPLVSLANQGFVATRRGFAQRIDNPRILVGGSTVSVAIRNDTCTVNASPVFPVEISTARTITREVLANKGVTLNPRLRGGSRSSVGFVEAIF